MPINAKNIKVATAVTISGTINGSVTNPLENSLLLNDPPLTTTKAVNVAIAVAQTVAIN